MDRLAAKSVAASREIQLIGGEVTTPHTTSNRVSSGKFTLLSFVPRTLAEILVQPSTVWFLLVVVLEANPFGLYYQSSYSTAVLLVLLLVLKVAKAGVALRRYTQSDEGYNAVPYQVWERGGFKTRASAELRVGNVLLLKEGERVPADMVLLSSPHGSCYFSTQRPIGESSLGLKAAVPPTYRFLQRSEPDFNLKRFYALFKIPQPNSDFASFSGSLKLPSLPRTVPLKPDHFLLRGSLVRGEDWILAVVVYAGKETKFWSNARTAAISLPCIERKLNLWVLGAAIVTVTLAGVQLLVQYLQSQETVRAEDFILYWLQYAGVVPVVVYIAIAALRLLFAVQSRDKEDFVQVSFNCALDDLGSTQYILADKTGTVTKNELELVAVLLGLQMYTKFPLFGSGKLDTIPPSEDERPTTGFNRDVVLTFDELKRIMELNESDELQRLCECVTLCNSVVIQKDNTHLATSADEAALMRGAKELGFELVSRGREECDIVYFDMCHSYRVLCVKKFTSDVKRMRIFVQQEMDDFATLYIKGAYAVMKDMIVMNSEERTALERRIKEMEEKGLRTMVMCYRQLEGDYLADVSVRAISAMSASLNVEGKLEVLLQELERDLCYLGVTGVLDNVQEDTAEMIAELAGAGVTTWLMSGEGESNTLATAYQLGMLAPGTPVLSLRGLKRPEDCHRRLIQLVSDLMQASQTESSAIEMGRFSLLLQDKAFQDQVHFALSIDSESLTAAISQGETQRLLLSLLLLASTCCFNTLLPGHKRQVAALMHANVSPTPVLLGIGDEASEIPMFRQTNTSAGIVKSDAGAVADIVVGSFTRLGELLLRQGRKASALIARTTLLFLYAQVLYVLAAVSFACIADFTAFMPVGIQGKALYTAVLTFFPMLYVGAQGFKQQDTAQLTRAELLCSLNLSFSLSTALRYLLLALLHYLCIATFLFPAFYCSTPCITTSEQGVMLLFALVCIVNMHCLVESPHVTGPLAGVTALSTALVLAVSAGNEEEIGAMEAVFSTPRLLLGLIGAVLWGLVGSQAFKLYFHMRDIKPFLSNDRKVIPLKPQGSEIRKIRHKTAQILLSNKQNPPEITPESFHLNHKGLFQGSTIETEFQHFFLSTNFPVLLGLMSLTLVIAVVRLALELWVEEEELDSVYTATLIGACIFALAVFLSRRAVTQAAWALSAGALSIAFILDLLDSSVSNTLYFYVVAMLLLFLREKWTMIFPLSVLACVFLTTSMAYSLSQNSVSYRSAINAFGTVLVQLLVQSLSGFHCYRNAQSRRDKFALLKQSEERIAQSDSVLSVLLPDFVRKQVRDGFGYIAEDKGQVSVIFIDICHFDEICAKYAPLELVALLDDIFLKIDSMCDSLNVAKIETVGKTYLACAGLRDFEFESTGEYIKIPHAKRCLDLAFAILSSFRHYPLEINQHLQFHIGINTGEVIAGVVGFHKPQFSLVGDTVNTSSRMSSTLTLPNTVQISSSTYHALSQKKDYEFEERLVTVKGKGDMETYVVRRANFTKRLSVQPELEEVVLIPHQRSSMRRGSATGHHLLMSEIIATNEKKLKENVGFFVRKSDELEVKFRMDLVHMACVKLSLVLFAVSTMTMFVFRLVLEVSETQYQPALVLVYFLATVSALVFKVFLQHLVRLHLMSWLLLVLYSITAIASAADSVYADGLPTGFLQLEIGFICVLVFHFSALFFRHAVVAMAVLVVPVAVLWASGGQENVSFAVFVFLFGVENCVFHYFMEVTQRKIYNASVFAMREIEKTEQLLTQMMPVHAYESLRHAEWSTDKLLGVSILYADISGFTSWSSHHQPHEVIEKLSKIFTLFDKICVKQGLYKVHTIGDCYVALSSTTNSEVRNRKDECVRMVSAALDMVRAVDEVCSVDHELLKMRIGVHCGDVVAGITGSRLVRYDIYGPDVLIANKMESSGKEGRVNVSAAVKALLEAAGAEFRFECNKTVEVPDIGVVVDSYFVSSPIGYVSE